MINLFDPELICCKRARVRAVEAPKYREVCMCSEDQLSKCRAAIFRYLPRSSTEVRPFTSEFDSDSQPSMFNTENRKSERFCDRNGKA